MKRRLWSIVLIPVLTTPFLSFADHQCIEERSTGKKIEIREQFPRNWLTVGNRLITDPKLHSTLRDAYSRYYAVGDDEGPYGLFCAARDGVYVTITTSDLAAGAEFSANPPKCRECKPIDETPQYLVSGTGLKIGMSKAKASAALGRVISEDVTTLRFEEMEKGREFDVYHSQELRLEFHLDRLVRFSIGDYRERYN